jgi:hypothetical protein
MKSALRYAVLFVTFVRLPARRGLADQMIGNN